MHKKSPSKIWRRQKNRYQIVGTKFDNGNEYYPPREFDTDSNSTKSKDVDLTAPAKLITWSVVYVSPQGYERFVPYAVAIIELANSQRLTGQIVDTDFDKLQKGDILFPTFRKFYEDSEKDVINYGLKWTK